VLVVLVRHGDAAFGVPDATRELTSRGKEEVHNAFLTYRDFRHRSILGNNDANGGLGRSASFRLMASPFLRAQQTAELITKVMEADGLQSPAATSSFLEPEADPNDVVALIEKAQTQGVTELWLVAHNPLLSTLLSLLVDGECQSQSQSPLATAEIVELEVEWVGLGCATVGFRA
jgi:phosphohistidine phosphatase SixA